MVKLVLRRVAQELRVGTDLFLAEEKAVGHGLLALVVSVSDTGGHWQPIGIIHVEGMPGQRTLVRVPPAGVIKSPPLSAFLEAALSELEKLGFLAGSSRFRSHTALDVARRELDAAEGSTSFANIGNSCRAALIALGNELYEPHMLPEGHTEPKGDDAKAKLSYLLKHYLAGRSEDYRTGFIRAIEGAWGMSVGLTHRKKATREEAEAVLAFLDAVFKAFSFIAPS